MTLEEIAHDYLVRYYYLLLTNYYPFGGFFLHRSPWLAGLVVTSHDETIHSFRLPPTTALAITRNGGVMTGRER
jgi:hypothetical protein